MEPHLVRACPFQDAELMSQRENLQLQVSPLAERRAKGEEERDNDGMHRRRPDPRKSVKVNVFKKNEF